MQNTGREWGRGKVTEAQNEGTMTTELKRRPNREPGGGGHTGLMLNTSWTNKGEEMQTRWVKQHSLCELHDPTCHCDCEGDTTL